MQAYRSENPGVTNDLSALVDMHAEHVVQIMGGREKPGVG